MTNDDVSELRERFKISCRKCGSEEVGISVTPGVNYGGQTGYVEGAFSIGCNACKENDLLLDN